MRWGLRGRWRGPEGVGSRLRVTGRRVFGERLGRLSPGVCPGHSVLQAAQPQRPPPKATLPKTASPTPSPPSRSAHLHSLQQDLTS